MRIGYFITHYPYENRLADAGLLKNYIYGGAEVAAQQLARQMVQRGHQVSIFTTSRDGRDSCVTEDNLHIYRYGTNLRIVRGNVSWGLFNRALQHDVDIVHADFTTPTAELAGLRYAGSKRKPFVLTYHGDWQTNFGSPVRRAALAVYNRFILHHLLARATTIICLSEPYINESRFLGKHREKISIIPLGIDIAQLETPHSKEECRRALGLPGDSRIILFLGNLTPYKGPQVLVRAMRQVAGEIPDARLVFCGDGILREELEKLTRELGLAGNVSFKGFIEEGLKPLYYKAADIFVLPSTMNTEVFPRVFLEAAVAGLPIVASDLDTFTCFIRDGENGIITKKGDADDLGQAIINLLGNPSLMTGLGQAARQNVAAYAWDNIAGRVEALYRGVLGR